ncbi:MAG TPA: VWA domain-containing protein [Bacilli bacterium]|nr:VWA domain-containing protein [Bacilli bacterium]
MGIDFAHPWWLLALLPAAYAIYWWYKDERRLQGARKKSVAVLRSLLFLLLVLAVAGAQFKAPLAHQQAIFVVDESKSVADDKQAVAWLQDAIRDKRPEDGYAILGLGEKPAVEYPMSTDNSPNLEFGLVQNPNFTNLAGGLRLAEGLAEPGYNPRVILLSDGEQNIGDAAREAAYLKDRGVRVDVVKLTRHSGSEVLIDSATVPSTLYQGETFNLDAVLQSTVATAAQLRVYEDNELVSTTPVDLKKGETRLALPLEAKDAGFHRYRVEVQAGQDTLSANNTAYAYGEVSGRPTALIVEGQTGEAKWLTQALNASGFPYEVRTPGTMPGQLEDLRRYAVIVLANASGTDVPEQTQQAVESAVRDFGIGLMMTGGDNSFGLGGYFNTPIEKALPVYMDIRNQEKIPSLGLLLVIDRSGSMSGDKIELAKEAARRSTKMLSPQDTLGVLAFDSAPWWVIEPTQVSDPEAMQEQISGIRAEGGTNIFPAVSDAFDRLKDVKTKRKHIILLTDGQSPNGDYEGLTELMRKEGITMSTVAVGNDADTALLQRLADLAKGRFYQTTDSQNVPQIFSKETALAGKTYIEDNPFTPAIGQAKEMLPLFEQGLPAINAQIATTAKETADTVLANPSGEPLLVRWQYGLGRAVAWTSDAKGVWSNQWAAWERSAAFWNQLMTWLLPQYRTTSLDLSANTAAGQGSLEVNLKQPLASGAVLKAEVIGSDLSREEVPLLLKAPGQYTGNFAAAKPGTYMISVQEQQGGQAVRAASTGLAVPYSPEYALAQNGDATLQAIAQAGGGVVLDDTEAAFADNLPAKWQSRDISLLLLLLAAILWPLDIALRRVRIPFDRLQAWWQARRKRAGQSTASTASAGTSVRGLKKKALQATQLRTGTTAEEKARETRGVKNTSDGRTQSSLATPTKEDKSLPTNSPPVTRPSPTASVQSQPTSKQPADEQDGNTVSRLLKKKRGQ